MLELKQETDMLPIDIKLLKVAVNMDVHETQYDELLKKVILSATNAVEEYTQRTITPKTWVYTHTHNILYLPRPIIKKILGVYSNGVKLEATEYKMVFTRDTTVLMLSNKYIEGENSVEYEAGYGEIDHIPFTLRNVIMKYATALFNNGIGIDTKTDEFVEKMINSTTYNPKSYVPARVKKPSSTTSSLRVHAA